ncbi:MAG: vitamin K epoxide reductase family protein [Candidatus Micrarchaeota archaeon]|nr:vitamin K epoxide reductase family protein [Candidatus Micrarchaeota archaeon]
MRHFDKAMGAIVILGLIISLYLIYVHFQPSGLYCPNAGIINCEQVLTSSYSAILGIPLAVQAFVWFAVLGVITFYRRLWKIPAFHIVKDVWLIIGLGGIMYSVIAMHLIGKICIYCSTLDVLIACAAIVHVYHARANRVSG